MVKFDDAHQIEQLKAKSIHLRTGFLRSLCSIGNVEMFAPFVACGLDLDKRDSNSATYLREAVGGGNMDLAAALLENGASVDPQNNVDTRTFMVVTSPVTALLHRWEQLGMNSRDEDSNNERWILQKLVRKPSFNDPDALFFILFSPLADRYLEFLLDNGCGRRGDGPPVCFRQQLHGSEIIDAIIHNNKYLPVLLRYNLGLEYEDSSGFTALLHAVNLPSRPIHHVKMLVEAGANVVKRTSSGYTALELAKENMESLYPRHVLTRWREGAGTNCLESASSTVTFEHDREVYEYLLGVARQRRVTRALTAVCELLYRSSCNITS